MSRWSIIALVLLGFGHAKADTIMGYVTAITDGDTLTLLDGHKTQHKIRLSGIDAPERTQPFGSKSTSNLAAMAFNKDAVANCPKRDRYGREVCKVMVKGQDVGLQQVKDGMAWWYVKYSKEQSPEDREAYEQAETWTKLRRQGLWNDTNPIPPWDWRHR